MSNQADIVVFGTGHFAARIVLDLAATADEEVSIVVAGRNSARAAWIRTAAAASFEAKKRLGHRQVASCGIDGAP